MLPRPTLVLIVGDVIMAFFMLLLGVGLVEVGALAMTFRMRVVPLQGGGFRVRVLLSFFRLPSTRSSSYRSMSPASMLLHRLDDHGTV
jgi:hypothetical protein